MLAITGYFIASPPASRRRARRARNFLMGYIRFAHFAAGQVLAVVFLVRIYWAFVGNDHARQIFYVPVLGSQAVLGRAA